jgi:3-hydroxy-9,10-secoandrosta-1,3,5(10)-triene-9,17-dione monooxygenase
MRAPAAGNMITDQVAQPSPEELVRRAKRLIPALAERAAKGDQERRIASETMAALRDAGLFRILQPRRWGGYELDPGLLFEVQFALGQGDLSTAWVYGTLASLNGLLALFDDRSARDVWGEDAAELICCSMMRTGNAVPVDGGFRLVGRWKYLSGCVHAGWAMLGGNVVSDSAGGGDARIFLVPRADTEIIDTWHVAGLKATGSHDAVVKDAFVPDYRTQKFIDCLRCEGAGQTMNTGALYRVPFGQIFARTPSVGSIGALQGMLDAFLDHAAARVTVMGRTAEDPVAQLVCAETASAIDEMIIVTRRNFHSLMTEAERGQVPPLPERMRYKFQSAAAAERCSLLAARLFKLAGAAALFDERPFGRFLADINAARQHIANQYETFGRSWGASLLGRESATDFFL